MRLHSKIYPTIILSNTCNISLKLLSVSLLKTQNLQVLNLSKKHPDLKNFLTTEKMEGIIINLKTLSQSQYTQLKKISSRQIIIELPTPCFIRLRQTNSPKLPLKTRAIPPIS
jgi:peroxiredoxin